ncbi:MAG: hypothetical protein AAGJ93_01165 [Bacteroidota bacterium]
MNQLIKCLLLLSFLWSLSPLNAQNNTLIFPERWQGVWSGELVISTVKGEAQRIPMLLKLLPLEDGRYTYTIVYGEETEENTRPYYLQAVEGEPGHFQVDEGNGIILDDYFINGKLYSRFEVMGTLLLSTVEERGDQLIYEIIAGPMEAINITGDTMIDEEEIPPVSSFAINVQQRAVLSRKE